MIWSVHNGHKDHDLVRWVVIRWHADSVEEAKAGPKTIKGYKVKRTFSTLEVFVPAILLSGAIEELELAGYDVEDERCAA